MLRFSLLACLLLLSGCMQIRTELQMKNPEVKPLLKGRDCVTLIMGLGYGANTIEEALKHGIPADSDDRYTPRIRATIKRIHSIALIEEYFIIAGERCILVEGE